MLQLERTCQKDDVVDLMRRARSLYLVLRRWVCPDSWMRAVVHVLNLGHSTEGSSILSSGYTYFNENRAPMILSIFKNRVTNMNKL